MSARSNQRAWPRRAAWMSLWCFFSSVVLMVIGSWMAWGYFRFEADHFIGVWLMKLGGLLNVAGICAAMAALSGARPVVLWALCGFVLNGLVLALLVHTFSIGYGRS